MRNPKYIVLQKNLFWISTHCTDCIEPLILVNNSSDWPEAGGVDAKVRVIAKLFVVELPLHISFLTKNGVEKRYSANELKTE